MPYYFVYPAIFHKEDNAKSVWENNRNDMANHFLDIGKMVEIGSKTKREIEDIMLLARAENKTIYNKKI